jgi:hypothetical protein
LEELASQWEQGALALRRAGPKVDRRCRARYRQEWVLTQFLALTWRSAANVELFLRLRDVVRAHSAQPWVREGHRRENLRDLDRMAVLAQAERRIARQAERLIAGADYLDLELRLDMGTAPTRQILRAKVEQLTALLDVELPAWRERLLRW